MLRLVAREPSEWPFGQGKVSGLDGILVRYNDQLTVGMGEVQAADDPFHSAGHLSEGLG